MNGRQAHSATRLSVAAPFRLRLPHLPHPSAMAAVLLNLRYSSWAHELGSTAAGIVDVAHTHTAIPLGDAQLDIFGPF